MKIDGRKYLAKEGATIIDTARAVGIDIPALGYDPRVSPPSGVEAAFVEVTEGGGTRFLSATSTPVQDGMAICCPAPGGGAGNGQTHGRLCL